MSGHNHTFRAILSQNQASNVHLYHFLLTLSVYSVQTCMFLISFFTDSLAAFERWLKNLYIFTEHHVCEFLAWRVLLTTAELKTEVSLGWTTWKMLHARYRTSDNKKSTIDFLNLNQQKSQNVK